MVNLAMLIKNIEKKINDPEILEGFLSEYINSGDSIDVLLEATNAFKDDKRNLILSIIADLSTFYLHKIAESKYLEDADRVYVIKKLINDNKYVSTIAYGVMRYVNNPKKCFNDDEIKWILKDVDIKEIIDKYGAYFSLELLDRPDYFHLLNVKKELSSEVLNKIYFKSFRSKHEYLNVISYLSAEEKKDYVKKFLKPGCINYEIAFDMISNKYYRGEDYARLLKVIENYAPANIIYEVLMNETLDKKEIDMLEKALLKTGNIEYISYYYFFKDREKFILLFGSALRFLSFVMLNEDKFKNKKLLNTIIESIAKEEKNFSQEVNSKVGVAYHKMQKTNNNGKKY